MMPSLLFSCTKLLVTMVFTFAFLDVIVVSDWEKNISGSADLHIPIHPALYGVACDIN